MLTALKITENVATECCYFNTVLSAFLLQVSIWYLRGYEPRGISAHVRLYSRYIDPTCLRVRPKAEKSHCLERRHIEGEQKH